MMDQHDTTLTVFVSFVILLGMMGNISVIVQTWRQKKTKIVAWVMISNVSLSNILKCVFDVPFMHYQVIRHWIFGQGMCKLHGMICHLTAHVSIHTLTVLSVMRAVEIVKQRQLSTRRLPRAICAIWLLSVVLSVPGGVFFRVQSVPDCGNKTTDYATDNQTQPIEYGEYCFLDSENNRYALVNTILLLGVSPFLFTCAATLYNLILRQDFRVGRKSDDYQRELSRIERMAIVSRKMRVTFWATFCCMLPLFTVTTVLAEGNLHDCSRRLFQFTCTLLSCSVLFAPMCWLCFGFTNKCTENVVARLRFAWCLFDTIYDVLECCPSEDDANLPV